MNNYVQLEITTADVSAFVDELAAKGVVLWDVEIPRPLTVHLKIAVSDISVVRTFALQRGDSCVVKRKVGNIWRFLNLKSRLFLIVIVAALFFLTWWLPTKVLFFEVNGCDVETQYKILDMAYEEGIYFGADSSAVKSSDFKNRIIRSIPAVEWAGVSLRGCVAVINVQIGTVESEIKPDEKTVSHIVANNDGLVSSVTVEQGTPYCLPGQVVRKGQILISGYVDCGILIKATQASGEIMAYTNRAVSAVLPLDSLVRTEKADCQTDYSIIIGKKHIKFHNSTGISEDSCVKMYSREYVSLPGGLYLPIALVKEEYYSYALSNEEEELDFRLLEDLSRDYICDQMLAGEILEESGQLDIQEDHALYSASYACIEQIGTSISEEFLSNERLFQ